MTTKDINNNDEYQPTQQFFYLNTGTYAVVITAHICVNKRKTDRKPKPKEKGRT